MLREAVERLIAERLEVAWKQLQAELRQEIVEELRIAIPREHELLYKVDTGMQQVLIDRAQESVDEVVEAWEKKQEQQPLTSPFEKLLTAAKDPTHGDHAQAWQMMHEIGQAVLVFMLDDPNEPKENGAPRQSGAGAAGGDRRDQEPAADASQTPDYVI